jgi:hypothetical protein
MGGFVHEGAKSCLGFTKITVDSSTAKGLHEGSLGPIPLPSEMALVIPEGAIRFRCDGTAPTSTNGMALVANQPLPFTGPLAAIKLIAQAGSVDIGVEFYRS